jgi:lysyl-tRNA synthetase class 2
MSARQEFLKSWKPYPPAPKEVLYSGRVVSAKVVKNFLVLKTERNLKVSEYSLEKETQWAEILQPGDIIAVDAAEEVHFLAPGEPMTAPVSLDVLKNWQRFLQLVREYFLKYDFLEINTPTLVTCPGTEPSLDVFSTELHHGSRNQKLFLPTSPELHLKKALVYGFDKIFEIKTCFRNGEFSEHHQPEFWMMEWYRSYSDLGLIEQDVRGLVNHVLSNFPQENMHWPQRHISTTMAELFREFAGLEITPWTTLEEYKAMTEKLGLNLRGATTIDDFFFAIVIEKIEPKLPKDALVAVKDYPPFQAALARINSRGWADRMEFYFGGFELANGFQELNDPEIQAQRFQEDLAKKKAMGKPDIQLDDQFMEFLKKGSPPSAGIALGLDRLFMAVFGISDIRKIKLFPY